MKMIYLFLISELIQKKGNIMLQKVIRLFGACVIKKVYKHKKGY